MLFLHTDSELLLTFFPREERTLAFVTLGKSSNRLFTDFSRIERFCRKLIFAITKVIAKTNEMWIINHTLKERRESLAYINTEAVTHFPLRDEPLLAPAVLFLFPSCKMSAREN